MDITKQDVVIKGIQSWLYLGVPGGKSLLNLQAIEEFTNLTKSLQTDS